MIIHIHFYGESRKWSVTFDLWPFTHRESFFTFNNNIVSSRVCILCTTCNILLCTMKAYVRRVILLYFEEREKVYYTCILRYCLDNRVYMGTIVLQVWLRWRRLWWSAWFIQKQWSWSLPTLPRLSMLRIPWKRNHLLHGKIPPRSSGRQYKW